MDDRSKKKMGAWLSAIVAAVLLGGYGLFVLVALALEPDLFLVLPLLLWVLIPLLAVAGVFAALWLRLREIDGGEEDEASKY
ncbi:MAG: hypothetical protein IJR48_10035 [Oscillibacter sp.]|nr:hypothetical protein [Oscillibacter sp.]